MRYGLCPASEAGLEWGRPRPHACNCNGLSGIASSRMGPAFAAQLWQPQPSFRVAAQGQASERGTVFAESVNAGRGGGSRESLKVGGGREEGALLWLEARTQGAHV